MNRIKKVAPLIKIKIFTIIFLFISSLSISFAEKNTCHRQEIWLQVLGSGGPEINDARASSGYLIWRNGFARVLVDLGVVVFHALNKARHP